ncbi:MAG: hypothetical protein WB543_20220 [Candidatus Acidiferrum sp.]
MGLEELTPRSAFLLFVGAATTVFFIMGGTALWEHKYLPGVFFLISGTALTYIFFRKGKIAVLFIGLIFILVNAGLTEVFHPSLPGAMLTVGSAVSLVLLARWQAQRSNAPRP